MFGPIIPSSAERDSILRKLAECVQRQDMPGISYWKKELRNLDDNEAMQARAAAQTAQNYGASLMGGAITASRRQRPQGYGLLGQQGSSLTSNVQQIQAMAEDQSIVLTMQGSIVLPMQGSTPTTRTPDAEEGVVEAIAQGEFLIPDDVVADLVGARGSMGEIIEDAQTEFTTTKVDKDGTIVSYGTSDPPYQSTGDGPVTRVAAIQSGIARLGNAYKDFA